MHHNEIRSFMIRKIYEILNSSLVFHKTNLVIFQTCSGCMCESGNTLKTVFADAFHLFLQADT